MPVSFILVGAYLPLETVLTFLKSLWIMISKTSSVVIFCIVLGLVSATSLDVKQNTRDHTVDKRQVPGGAATSSNEEAAAAIKKYLHLEPSFT